MRIPYIGITGFMTPEEVTNILKLTPLSERLIMIGALVSQKTLRGKPGKWPNRYPKIEKIKDIFPNSTRALNFIHYHTKDVENLYEQLIRLTELGGSNLDGFQLNIAWPPSLAIHLYRSLHANKRIVLQIGGRAFKKINHSPEALASKIAEEYSSIIDYILLDASGGLGVPLNVELTLSYLRALKEKDLENIGLGIAGGLCPATLHAIEPLIQEFPTVSIDAEGKLRDENDHLNTNLALTYVRQAIRMFKKD